MLIWVKKGWAAWARTSRILDPQADQSFVRYGKNQSSTSRC
jgi:hypothetical protein